jgi:hypothetical protein
VGKFVDRCQQLHRGAHHATARRDRSRSGRQSDRVASALPPGRHAAVRRKARRSDRKLEPAG